MKPRLFCASVAMATVLLLLSAFGPTIAVDRSDPHAFGVEAVHDDGETAKKSFTDLGGLHISIQRLHWKGAALEAAFVMERDGGPSASQWGSIHPWFRLYVLFWDSSEHQIMEESVADCLYAPDFLQHKQDKDTCNFMFTPPPAACHVAIQYGTGPYFTGKVPIPEH